MIYKRLTGLFALLMLNVSFTYAQQAPDIEAIKDSISNPASTLYYPLLMERYTQMDSTLTLNDYHYLYYGYADQDGYKPLVDNSAAIELEAIMGKRSMPTSDEYFRAIVLCKAILEIEPFNLRDINALAYLYTQIGHKNKAEQLMRRLDLIVQTIMNSGTGLKEESPMWIIYFNHATDLLDMMSLKQGQPIIMSRTVEFIPVTNMPDKQDKGYYFNFSQIYARRPDYLDHVKAPKRKINLKPWEPSTKFKF